MARTRSEYRLAERTVAGTQPVVALRPVVDDDGAELATVLLDGYRGTVDDEGEDLDDAVEAIAAMLDTAIPAASFAAIVDGKIVGFSFVIELDGVHYIDPVVVASPFKRTGVGAAAVRRSLDALAADGITEVGATITDGNVASEALFQRLGFVRHGRWS